MHAILEQIYKLILIELKVEIDSSIVIGDFSTTLSELERSDRQDMNKETAELNFTLNQMYLTAISRIFHTTAEAYTFF